MSRSVLFDTETTGLDPATGDRVIEVAALELVRDLPTGRHFHRFIDPERDIPEEATRVHGITRADLRGKPRFAEVADEFAGQVSLVQEVLDAMGIAHVSKEGFEADDVIATLTTAGRSAGMEVLICSGDRDALQLVDEKVTVLYPRKGVSDLARMTPTAVEEKYGVPPERYSDLAALVGESADNLPGVPGVGPKTAAKWLAEYETLDGVIAAAASAARPSGTGVENC